jgi:hypothetical protein
MRRAGHIAHMRKNRNAYMILVVKPEGRRLLGRPRRGWEKNSKMDFREEGVYGLD